jgi:uncharacterized protein (TIGR02466 family)
MKNDFEEIEIFPTLVYVASALENVELIKTVAEEYFSENENNNNIEMSESFFHDDRIFNFSKYILQSAWNILKRQGFLMENYNTVFESMWLQTYTKHAYMPQHTHANNTQLVGFYFLEVPENSSKLIFHDPRIAKTQINLDESDIKNFTNASQSAVLDPKVGQLILAPAWIAHSITANESDTPIKFVHINIQAQRIANNKCCPKPEVEII